MQIIRPPRFTTTRVDEAEHAASVGMNFSSRFNPDLQEIPKYSGSPSTSEENHSYNLVQNNKDEKNTKTSSSKAPGAHGFTIEKDKDNKWDYK